MQSIVDRLRTTGSVKTVFGDPVEAKGRTIIPVAKIAYASVGELAEMRNPTLKTVRAGRVSEREWSFTQRVCWKSEKI